MKIWISSLACAFVLGAGVAHAAGAGAGADPTKPDPKHLKRLNACNKEAKGAAGDNYREAMKACMARKG